MALIYAEEGGWEALDDDARQAAYDRYTSFADDARAAGVLVAGDELASTQDATTVRLRDQQLVVTDGPYAEVKEALGGFFILDCASIDEAVDWAARIPGAEHGAVEVRAVHVDEEES
jgi:hypothetical protein